ncbi:MAG: c-type cytochrome [Gammaproteobacteria bacterium]|nr:c-type cytochrome [Gammaproteobacteria bacterium]
MWRLERQSKLLAILAFFGGIALAQGDEQATEPSIAEAGERVASQCAECHGEGGRSQTRDVPSIAGFSMLATMELLDTYRRGLREARTVELPDGTKTDMVEVVDSLSNADEWAVVIYYANQQWQPHEQPFDADLARQGAEIHAEKCDRCHYDGGRDPESDLPISAGQWREYLVAEFDNFDSGRRAMSDKMREKYDTLSAAEKRAIIELYVSAGEY